MKKNCELQNLEGVKKKLVPAVFLGTPSKLNDIIKNGFAATAAGSNGAFNVWRDDKGVLRSTAYRYCMLQEAATHTSLSKAKEWAKKWFSEIK